MMKNQVKQAIDSGLSSLRATDRNYRIITDNIREGKQVKKKLSVGLVLAIVLMLVTVTALALVTWNAYLENVISIEGERGYFFSWSFDDKLRLIEAMQEYGIEVPRDKLESLQDKALTDIERDQIATAIITERYGREDAISHISIMEKEKGPFDTWSLEDKAWYTEQLVKYGLPGPDHERYLLPGEGDMQEKEAVEFAQKTMLEKFTWPEDQLVSFPVQAAFKQSTQYGEAPVWLVQITAPNGMYLIVFSGQGDIVSIVSPAGEVLATASSVADIPLGAKLVEPQAHDATQEQAILNAKGILTEVVDLPQEEADEFTPSASFFYHEQYCMGTEPVWLVVFSREGEPAYKVLLGYDGSHIDWAPADKEFSNDRRIGEELGSLSDFVDPQGIWIYDWSLEDKAAFSQKWIPIAEAYKERNPYIAARRNTIWELTRRVFGLPGSQDISQDEALRVAQDAAKQMGATDKMIERLSRHAFFFDITQADKPQWRIMITRSASTGSYQEGDEKQYYVKIDARTGAVIEAHDGSYYNDPVSFVSEP